MDRLKVLVVDDKRIIGDVFDMTLGAKGHQIFTAYNEPDVVSLIQEKTFDIAFVDFVMPEDGGLKILQKIKELAPGLPVVMMSGYTIEEQKEKARQLGMAGFLKKPFDLDELGRVIKIVIDKDV